jgi:hypothetical protein
MQSASRSERKNIHHHQITSTYMKTLCVQHTWTFRMCHWANSFCCTRRFCDIIKLGPSYMYHHPGSSSQLTAPRLLDCKLKHLELVMIVLGAQGCLNSIRRRGSTIVPPMRRRKLVAGAWCQKMVWWHGHELQTVSEYQNSFEAGHPTLGICPWAGKAITWSRPPSQSMSYNHMSSNSTLRILHYISEKVMEGHSDC